MDIKAIDKGSVHRLCSGQVVLTLSTAVKELVENSLDAGAKNISIRMKMSGLELIEVADDGCGVVEENYQALTLKHFTSKISSFSDLTSVQTFGFRGEALSSLCALSKLTIVTRTQENKVATRIVYDQNGKIITKTSCHREPGTTVIIENIFSPLPVRRKELERNVSKEFNKMVTNISGYCLLCEGVKMVMTNQAKNKGSPTTVLKISPNNSIKANIIDVFGIKQWSSLKELKMVGPDDDVLKEFNIKETPEHNFSITGYISSAEHGKGRSSTDRQFLFINKRPFDSAKLCRLTNEVYHTYNRSQSPFLLLNINTLTSNVDVNVTPDKRQVFMHNEKLLLALVKSSLKSLYANIPSECLSLSSSLTLKRTLNNNNNNNNDDDDDDALKKSSSSSVIQLFKKQKTLDESISFLTPPSSSQNSNEEYHHKKEDNKNNNNDNNKDNDKDNDNKDNDNNSDHFNNMNNNDNNNMNNNDNNDNKSEIKRDFFNNLRIIMDNEPQQQQNAQHQNSPLQHPQIPYQQKPLPHNQKHHQQHKKPQQQHKRQKQQKSCSYDNDGDDDDDDSNDYISSRQTVEVPFSMEKLKRSFFKIQKTTTDERVGGSERRFKAEIKAGDNGRAEEELKRAIDKSSFRRMRILGQFNLGFIIALLPPNNLFIIDQHATDEKYNFEWLEKNVVLQNQKLICPQNLQLTACNESVLMENLQVFHLNGFEFSIQSEAPPTQKVHLTSIPTSRNWTFGQQDIEEMIFMLSDAPRTLCRPSRIRQMLASRACRRSVMIGTALKMPEMEKIVRHMSHMDQPWNCPHGRPTIRHLIDLNMIHLH